MVTGSMGWSWIIAAHRAKLVAMQRRPKRNTQQRPIRVLLSTPSFARTGIGMAYMTMSHTVDIIPVVSGTTNLLSPKHFPSGRGQTAISCKSAINKPVKELTAVTMKTAHATFRNILPRKMLVLKSRIDALTQKTHKFWNINMAALDLGSQSLS